MPFIIDVNGETLAVEFVFRGSDRPAQYPVCTWDGANGTNVARTPDGRRWFVCDYAGYGTGQTWHPIQTPSVQPALRG